MLVCLLLLSMMQFRVSFAGSIRRGHVLDIVHVVHREHVSLVAL